MKLLIKTLLLTLFSITLIPVFADTCVTTGYQQGTNYFGKTECQKVVMASQLKVNGQMKIDSLTVNGNATINGTAEGRDLNVNGSLIISGKTTLNKVKILGPTQIEGQTTLSNANLQNLTVKGKLNASGSQFADTIVNGSINLHDVIIKGSLTINSSLAVLNGVDVKNILIKNTLSNQSQIVCLEKGSRVQGNIHFETGHGKVYSIGASKILGKVEGGEVIQGACPNQGEMTIQ